MDIEAARNVTHGFVAAIPPPDRLALLVRGELRLAPHLHATSLGPLAALACARPDKVTLELCEAASARSASAARVMWWCPCVA